MIFLYNSKVSIKRAPGLEGLTPRTLFLFVFHLKCLNVAHQSSRLDELLHEGRNGLGFKSLSRAQIFNGARFAVYLQLIALMDPFYGLSALENGGPC